MWIFMPLEGSEGTSPFLIVMAAAIPLVSAATALIIAVRRPGNRVAWVLFGISLGVLLLLANPWQDGSPAPIEPTYFDFVTVSYSRVALWVGLFLPLFTLAYLFPTGRFVTRRSAWIGRYVVTAVTVILLLVAFSEEAWVGYVPVSEAAWIIQSPIGFVPSWLFDGAVFLLLNVAGLFLAIGGILSMFWRFRRSGVTERAQIKWLLYAMALAVFAPFIVIFGGFPGSENVVGLGLLGGAFLVPIAITVAIVQFRLFDIDRIISRTVGYLIVVSLLAAVYVVGAVWLPSRLIGEQRPIFIAGGTLAAAALFNPLRKRVLLFVDRRFNRSSYDAAQLIEHFGNVISGQREITGLIEKTTSVVTTAIQPTSIGFWVKREDSNIEPEHSVSGQVR